MLRETRRILLDDILSISSLIDEGKCLVKAVLCFMYAESFEIYDSGRQALKILSMNLLRPKRNVLECILIASR